MDTLEVSSDKTRLLGSQKNEQKSIRLYTIVIFFFIAVIVTLGMLNLYQAGVFDSNSTENEAITITECNGNGKRFNDIEVCECIQCWSGENCEIEEEDCMVSTGGNPNMFVEFWDMKAAEGEIDINIPINYRVPYQSNMIGPYSESQNTTFAQRLSQLIRRVHIKYHNVNMTNKVIVYGLGASHITTASFVAWSQMKGETVIAYDEVPYYFGHQTRCRGASEYHCEWWNKQEINESDYGRIVEVVTIPNNPDGRIRERQFPMIDSYALDLVYHWPIFYDSDDELVPYDAPLAYFSLSKLSGHAGSRFGWAVVDASSDLASTMRSYINACLLSLSAETLRRAYAIFSYIEENGDEYFDFIKERLAERWDDLYDILDDTDMYINEGRRGQFFAWIKCVNKNHTECRDVFRNNNISPNLGTSFGVDEDEGYVRLNMAEYEDTWQRMLVNFRQLVDGEESQ